MKKICLRDCKMDGIILVRGAEYDIEWNPVSKCMFVHTVWGDIPLNDAEYKNIFAYNKDIEIGKNFCKIYNVNIFLHLNLNLTYLNYLKFE